MKKEVWRLFVSILCLSLATGILFTLMEKLGELWPITLFTLWPMLIFGYYRWIKAYKYVIIDGKREEK